MILAKIRKIIYYLIHFFKNIFKSNRIKNKKPLSPRHEVNLYIDSDNIGLNIDSDEDY